MSNFLFYFVLGVSLLIVGIIYEDKLVEVEDYIINKIKSCLNKGKLKND